MKRLLIICLLIFLSIPCYAAWTDRYVSVAGAGSHDGTTEGNAFTLAEAIADAATPHAGYRYNVIAGTYANTTTSRAFAGAGSTTAPIWWRGYKTTAGDLDDGHTVARSLQDGVNLPLITFSTGQMTVAGAYQIFSNLDITSATTTANGAVYLTGGNIRVQDSRIENTAANSASRSLSVATAGPNYILRCRLKATTTATYNVSAGAGTTISGSWIIGGATALYQTSHLTVIRSVIEGYATNGFLNGAAINNILLDHDSFYSSGSTNGISIATIMTSGTCLVSNTIIGGATNGINNASASAGVALNRVHFYGCTNNLVNVTEAADVTADLGVLGGLIDDDTDPWNSKATEDFSLASGNAIDKSTASPGIFEGQTAMVSYGDIGAVRHQDPAAGSSTGNNFISFLFGSGLVGAGLAFMRFRTV
jgi:hypothetical protein